DNASTPSTCTLCPVGCSMALDERDNEIVRTRSIENPAVNDVWLCDKGWFGYEFASHPDRLKTPLMRKNGKLVEASWEEAFSAIASNVRASQNGKLAALGGNALTIEENYLFQQLVRKGFNTPHIDSRVGTPLISIEEEGLPPGMKSQPDKFKELNFVLLLGLDITEEFPVLWLRLKEAINLGTQAVFIGHYAPEIASHLKESILHAPGDELSLLQSHLEKISKHSENAKTAIFVGRQYLASPHRKVVLTELLKLQGSRDNFTINIMEGRGNYLGARFAGVHPELGPFNEALSSKGLNSIEILQTAAQTGWDYLHIVSANPAGKMPKALWEKARKATKFLVVQDLFLTETAKNADIVLPTLCFFEKEGHFLSISGKIEQLNPGIILPHGIFSDGHIFKEIAKYLDLIAIDANFIELIKHKADEAFKTDHRIELTSSPDTIKANFVQHDKENEQEKENSGILALAATFAQPLFDRGVRMLHNLRLRHLAKDPKVEIHPEDGKRLGIQDGDNVNLSHDGATISAVAALNSRIARGAILLPMGFEELNSNALSPNLINGAPIVVTK
ncbi:MAG: molybdopterin-dependent oxidoreductase, partial [Parachlamydiaceae bacterium]|nr:molybdopterin-dependent oxidoreductase [Parachlamydiaceae bacterium]